MKRIVTIALVLLVTACAAQQNEVKPRPFTYQDCMDIVKNEVFCRDHSSP